MQSPKVKLPSVTLQDVPLAGPSHSHSDDLWSASAKRMSLNADEISSQEVHRGQPFKDVRGEQRALLIALTQTECDEGGNPMRATPEAAAGARRMSRLLEAIDFPSEMISGPDVSQQNILESLQRCSHVKKLLVYFAVPACACWVSNIQATRSHRLECHLTTYNSCFFEVPKDERPFPSEPPLDSLALPALLDHIIDLAIPQVLLIIDYPVTVKLFNRRHDQIRILTAGLSGQAAAEIEGVSALVHYFERRIRRSQARERISTPVLVADLRKAFQSAPTSTLPQIHGNGRFEFEIDGYSHRFGGDVPQSLDDPLPAIPPKPPPPLNSVSEGDGGPVESGLDKYHEEDHKVEKLLAPLNAEPHKDWQLTATENPSWLDDLPDEDRAAARLDEGFLGGLADRSGVSALAGSTEGLIVGYDAALCVVNNGAASVEARPGKWHAVARASKVCAGIQEKASGRSVLSVFTEHESGLQLDAFTELGVNRNPVISICQEGKEIAIGDETGGVRVFQIVATAEGAKLSLRQTYLAGGRVLAVSIGEGRLHVLTERREGLFSMRLDAKQPEARVLHGTATTAALDAGGNRIAIASGSEIQVLECTDGLWTRMRTIPMEQTVMALAFIGPQLLIGTPQGIAVRLV